MKKILITGKNSYVGTSLQKWLENDTDKYLVNSVSVRNESWKEEDFSDYDVVIHVAGIAHIKETKANTNLYYQVNRDLAFEVAQKSKAEGVKQFIFMSSMSVYGIESGVIDKDSPLKPKSNYGKSKLEAEKLIAYLENISFKVAILRPPMIYGKGCIGNYTRLASLAVKTPMFPDIENKRSMIYIDNLCEFVRFLIDNGSNGLFLPQNKEYVCSSELVKLIAEINEKKIKLTRLINPFLRIIQNSTLNKVFGDLVYDKYLSEQQFEYQVYDFESSIRLTEGRH